MLIWNARGLNSRARHNVVRSIVQQQRASIVCLQESKIENFSVSLNTEITGFDFDYISLPASGVAGGATISWVGLQHLALDQHAALVDWWLQAHEAVPQEQRRAFDSMVLVVSWILWKERNVRTFDLKSRTSNQVIDAIKDEINAYIGAGYRCLASLAALQA